MPQEEDPLSTPDEETPVELPLTLEEQTVQVIRSISEGNAHLLKALIYIEETLRDLANELVDLSARLVEEKSLEIVKGDPNAN